MIAATEITTQSNKKYIDGLLKQYLNEAYAELEKVITENLEKDARNRYNYMFRSIETGIKQNLPSGRLSDTSIRNAVYASLGGATISQRLARHKQNLFKDATSILQKEITTAISEGMSRGDSIDRMTKEVKSMLNTSRYKARKIVRTESHRMREWATNEAMDEAKNYSDMFKKEWLATNDGRTRQLHRELNGKFENSEGYFVINGMQTRYPGGFGIASMDIHCRCTLVANFDEVLESNDYINQDNLSLNDWANKPELPGKYNGLSTILQGDNLEMMVWYIGTLNQDLYPKSVISELLQSKFEEDIIDEEQIKRKLRAVYLKYIKKGYNDMGIELFPDKNTDIEVEAKNYALVKHIKDFIPDLQLNKLTYRMDETSNLGWYMPSLGRININANYSRLSSLERLKHAEKMITLNKGISWSAQVDSRFDVIETTIIHELGHALDFRGLRRAISDEIPLSNVNYNVSVYGKTNRYEAAAESFLNCVLSSNPSKKSLKMWESMGYSLEGINNVKYAKLLE